MNDLFGQPKFSAETAAYLQAEILLACRKKGIPRSEANDLSGEIWIWLMGIHPPQVVSRKWVRSLVRKFWISHRRKWLRQSQRETPLDEDANHYPQTPQDSLETMPPEENLEKLEGIERQLVELILGGKSWSETCTALAIPAGSRSYWKRRLRKRLNRLFG